VDRTDVQALVFTGYSRRQASAIVLLDFTRGDGRGWLRRFLPRITGGAAPPLPSTAFNIAFTPAGLEALGVAPETLAEFSPEFLQGMSHPERSRILGDSGEDAPETWRFGTKADAVNAVVLVYSETPDALSRELEELEQGLARFSVGSRTIRTFLPADRREHFGVRMTASQPGLTRAERRRGRDKVPYGEFLLGYRNAFGARAECPTAPFVRSTRELPPLVGRRRIALGHNGSYLVVRQIEQRVELLADSVRHWNLPEARQLLAEHARRAQPGLALGDGALRHRLLRRGRLYGSGGAEGSPGNSERGMMFVALNADLSRQFETVQGMFLNGCGFGGPGRADPSVERTGPQRLVRVRGGLYGFLPSLRALNYLLDAGNARIP